MIFNNCSGLQGSVVANVSPRGVTGKINTATRLEAATRAVPPADTHGIFAIRQECEGGSSPLGRLLLMFSLSSRTSSNSSFLNIL